MGARQSKQQRQRAKPSLRVINNHERFAPTPEVLRKRAALLAQCIQLYPEIVARGLAQREESNWEFGRLFLVGALSKSQYEASKTLARVVQSYKRIMHRYGLPGAQDLANIVTGARPHENLSDAALAKARNIYNEYNATIQKVDKAGVPAREECLRVLDTDRVRRLELVQHGLDALSSGR